MTTSIPLPNGYSLALTRLVRLLALSLLMAAGCSHSGDPTPIDAGATASGAAAAPGGSAGTGGGLEKVNHIIIIMQENHSFDNYFGALAYAPGSPYHRTDDPVCTSNPNSCIDGLDCTRDKTSGAYNCRNSNMDGCARNNPKSKGFSCAAPQRPVTAFHDDNYCPAPDLDHGFVESHQEANLLDPNDSLHAKSDGFVAVNDQTEQIDATGARDDTMGFYNESDLPYYYALAETFAINDRYFCSLLGPTFPNRSYLMTATSFGHTTTSEQTPPIPNGYQPLTGTIFDLMDAKNVSWADYFTDLPQGASFRDPVAPHFLPAAAFLAQAATGTLPAVSFIDPAFAAGANFQTDEHPPHDIRAGQLWVAAIVNAFRQTVSWQDSIIFVTYDEHGGFYDHVIPPAAVPPEPTPPDVFKPTDKAIPPGKCADRGGSSNCSISAADAADLASLTSPGEKLAVFDQLGFRVPLIAISRFAKPRYVSHTVADHTSLLALIEKRFLSGEHLTARDSAANTMEDLFNFNCDAMHSCNDSPAPPLPPPPSPLDGNGSCLSVPPAGSLAP